MQIEKGLKVVKFLGLFLKLASLNVEVSDLIVSARNDFGAGFSGVLGHIVLELNSELLNNYTEASKATLNVLGLLVLQRKD